LRDKTRNDYAAQIKKIEVKFGDMPSKALADRRARGVFLDWRDELAVKSLRGADYAWTVLLRARGLLSVDEIASALGVCRATIQLWRRTGLLAAHRCDDKGQYLFERPGPDTPVKYQRQDKTTARSIP
jgi:hypothetical protein